MSLMRTILQSVADNTVSIPNTNFANFDPESGPIYSGVKFDNDGKVYKRQKNGGWSSYGTWLVKGAAGSYYIQRTIDSGTLTTDGTDGVVLSTDRIYSILQSTPYATKTATVTFEISTDAPGTTVVAGPVSMTFSAFFETGS